jgi:hypothetical protein
MIKNNIINDIEKTTIIRIPQSNYLNKNHNFSNNYSLKSNLFDPINNSPPNEFMTKLQQRMKIYNVK